VLQSQHMGMASVNISDECNRHEYRVRDLSGLSKVINLKYSYICMFIVTRYRLVRKARPPY